MHNASRDGLHQSCLDGWKHVERKDLRAVPWKPTPKVLSVEDCLRPRWAGRKGRVSGLENHPVCFRAFSWVGGIFPLGGRGGGGLRGSAVRHWNSSSEVTHREIIADGLRRAWFELRYHVTPSALLLRLRRQVELNAVPSKEMSLSRAGGGRERGNGKGRHPWIQG